MRLAATLDCKDAAGRAADFFFAAAFFGAASRFSLAGFVRLAAAGVAFATSRFAGAAGPFAGLRAALFLAGLVAAVLFRGSPFCTGVCLSAASSGTAFLTGRLPVAGASAAACCFAPAFLAGAFLAAIFLLAVWLAAGFRLDEADLARGFGLCDSTDSASAVLVTAFARGVSCAPDALSPDAWFASDLASGAAAVAPGRQSTPQMPPSQPPGRPLSSISTSRSPKSC